MLALVETPCGFALFKVLKERKMSQVYFDKEFSSPDSARKMVELKAFDKFDNTSEALIAVTQLIKGAPSNGLRKFLKANCEGETLAVADSKLGNIIKEKLKIDCVHNNSVLGLLRGVRSQLTELISDLGHQDLAPMSLGLSHSLARYTLKFSADKVDTMVVQAVNLLNDIEIELNTYAMKLREWYGCHFPELDKIIKDSIRYAKSVKLMGHRYNAPKLDFSEILSDEVETELKQAAVYSMGTELSDLDLMHIRELSEQLLSLFKYRADLCDYLKSRMNTIAPNLTALVGARVGARLISHGSSLLNLSKQPASTIQILGAEKTLFRALEAKRAPPVGELVGPELTSHVLNLAPPVGELVGPELTSHVLNLSNQGAESALQAKHATPKHGLIYYASVVAEAPGEYKGKMSRSLAAKCALAIRCDALGDDQDGTMGLEHRAKLDVRLEYLRRLSASAKGKAKIEVYDKDEKMGSGALITPAKTYNTAANSLLGQTSTQSESTKKKDKKKKNVEEEEEPEKEEEEPSKKKKKKKKKVEEEGEPEEGDASKKKKKAEVETEAVEVAKAEKKNKKKRKHEDEEATETPAKKKKNKD